MPTSTTLTTPSPAELLLALLMSAATLTDEQKELYINELLEGRLHPELEANLRNIIEAEKGAADQEIQNLQDLKASTESLMQKEQIAFQEAAEPVIAQYEKDVQGIVLDYKDDCARIERSLNQEVENVVKTEKDDKEEDAIRNFLKNKK